MAPVVRIPEPIYKRLQSVAVPLEDTVVTVIDRLLSEHEVRNRSAEDENVRILNPEAPGDLRHTKVLNARVNGVEIRLPNWSKLVDAVHVLALQRGTSVEVLNKITASHIKAGEHTDSGFHHLREADISIQGMQADKSWRDVLHLAKYMNIAVEVTFEWRSKEGASYPGEKGRIYWSSASI